MELGEKMKQARLAAGLSQRQLCGDTITRNMLSQIENGTARPSMDTLRILAGRLGKSVSYFLEEEAVTSPNRQVMERARDAFLRQNFREILQILEEFRGPDPVFEAERRLLRNEALLSLAGEAVRENREGYALECLEALGQVRDGYCAGMLERRRMLLLAKLRPRSNKLPDMDEELLMMAEAALGAGAYARSGHLLEAMENRESAAWNFLRGHVYEEERAYAPAVECYLRAEPELGEAVWPKLERCFRELGDYRRAYEYACLRRGE